MIVCSSAAAQLVMAKEARPKAMFTKLYNICKITFVDKFV